MKTKKILFCFIFISIYIQNIFSEKVYLEVSSGVSKWVYTISIEEYNKQGKIIYEKTFLGDFFLKLELYFMVGINYLGSMYISIFIIVLFIISRY